MTIDKAILDELTEQAKASPRLRMHYDLRNSIDDKSQRMLNAIEPGTEIPIHRHWTSSETVICIRGHFLECLYDENGNLVEKIDMVPGGDFINIPIGQWHQIISLESGTILFEAKDGAYAPVEEKDILKQDKASALKHQIEEFIENEGKSCSMDEGCITPEYIYRMWGGRIPMEEIKDAMASMSKPSALL